MRRLPRPLRGGAIPVVIALLIVACGGSIELSEPPGPSDTDAAAADDGASADDPDTGAGGDGSSNASDDDAVTAEDPDTATGGDDGDGSAPTGDDGGDGTPGVATNPQPGSAGVDDPYYPSLGNGGYDVERYDLDLAWDPERTFLSGTATITATATQDLSSFNLDFDGMEIDGITLDGADTPFARDEPELIITPNQPLASGQDFELVVTYRGEPGPAGPNTVIGEGGWTVRDDVSFVAGEPGGASGWFPVNDHPIDKAQFTLRFTVPSDEVVAANGLLQERTENGDTTTWVYETAFPQAPYLTTVVIGDLELIDVGEVDGIVVRHAIDAGIADSVLPRLADTERMIEVLSDLFGPYPFESYGIVMVDEPLGFALETQTLSIFGSDFLSAGAFFQEVLVHELAHQWFGNSLAVAEWDEIWLNEGFASYAQNLYLEATEEGYDIDAAMSDMARFQGVLLGDPPPGDPGADDLFAATVYLRGALTLHALRRTVGDDAFFEIVQRYVREHTGGNVETPDFTSIAEDVSGQDLDELFDAWLYQPGLPALPS